MKRILMITTGGTIACRRTGDGLVPVMTPRELLRYVPAAESICHIETYALMNKDSTEITPADWLDMAGCIQRHYADYDGFVVCHGTDTMAYTSAAISYLAQDSAKPIVVTGAQQPIDMESTDARQNLLDSFLWAASPGAHGVSIVFDGEAIAGTRAKKTRTKSYNAFSSTNYPALAAIKGGRIVQFIEPAYKPQPRFFTALNERVSLLKLAPGSPPSMLEFLLAHNDGIVVESFGSGGLPARFYPALEQGVAAGKTIVMATQVPNEGSDMTVYHVGKGIKERLGLLEAFDMTLEASITKLMWILAQTCDANDARQLFYATINSDILMRD